MAPFGYSMIGYTRMIADRVRTEAYSQALRTLVRPGSVVADLGTGTGFFALLAAQCGARVVYGIEPCSIVGFAKELAAANGCGDRIRFMQRMSTDVSLPEPADVIVSDLRGALPLFQSGLPSIIDARDRLLAPGGTLVPQRDRVWAALASAPELFSSSLDATDARLGVDMTPARRFITNTLWSARIRAERLLVEPRCWWVIDYATLRHADGAGTLAWTIDRRAVAHGVALWFDSVLCDGVGFSNAPGDRQSAYGHLVLPFPEPLQLGEGDVVTVDVKATLTNGEYVWCWDTRIDAGGRAPARSFRQSTFYGQPLSRPDLSRRAPSYVPRLNQAGAVNRLAFEMMSTSRPLGDIAATLTDTFPDRFGSPAQALTYVGDLSAQFSI